MGDDLEWNEKDNRETVMLQHIPLFCIRISMLLMLAITLSHYIYGIYIVIYNTYLYIKCAFFHLAFTLHLYSLLASYTLCCGYLMHAVKI